VKRALPKILQKKEGKIRQALFEYVDSDFFFFKLAIDSARAWLDA